MLLRNFSTNPNNKYAITLETLIKKILQTRPKATMFPESDNALQVLVRKASNQTEYDTVADIFRKHAPIHFQRAHWKQYVNVSVADGRLSGRRSRASSILRYRGINANRNRPKTSGGSRLGPSTILTNINGSANGRNNRGRSTSRRRGPVPMNTTVNNLTARVSQVSLEQQLAEREQQLATALAKINRLQRRQMQQRLRNANATSTRRRRMSTMP